MTELFTLEETEALVEDTGGVEVSYGGNTTRGHRGRFTGRFGDDPASVSTSIQFVDIPAHALPGIGVHDGKGEVSGVGEDIVVGDYEWTVREIEDVEEEDEGEYPMIRVFLTGRRTNSG